MTRRGRLGTGFAIGVLALLGVALSGIGFGDPALFPSRSGEGVPVYLVSNGYHSGLLLPREKAAEVGSERGLAAAIAVAARFRDYDWIETGWGEDRFYREAPSLAILDWRLALRALFWPGNRSVMHVVGVGGEPRAAFPELDLVRIELSPEGFSRLLAEIDRSFARGPDARPEELGPGLYGPSLFYRAKDAFSLVNLCNHWTARRLAAAGVPVWPLAATLPRGLVLDLALRSGLRLLPRGLPAPAATL